MLFNIYEVYEVYSPQRQNTITATGMKFYTNNFIEYIYKKI